MDENSRVHTVFKPFCLVFQWLLDCIEPGWHSIWSGKRDLNPQPSAWEADTLPLSYSRTDEYYMERETGFEPATSTLARLHSTTELLPQQREIAIRVLFLIVNKK